MNEGVSRFASDAERDRLLPPQTFHRRINVIRVELPRLRECLIYETRRLKEVQS